MPTKRKPPAERELRRQVAKLRRSVRELLDENRRAVLARCAAQERIEAARAALALFLGPGLDHVTLIGLCDRARREVEHLRAAGFENNDLRRERDEARAELALAINGLPRALQVPEYVTECPVPPDHRARAIFTNIDEPPIVLAEAPQITERRSRYAQEVPRG